MSVDAAVEVVAPVGALPERNAEGAAECVCPAATADEQFPLS